MWTWGVVPLGAGVVIALGALTVPAADATSRALGADQAVASGPPSTLASTALKAVATTPPPSPEHPIPEGSGTGRRIVYCNSCQRVWLVSGDGSIHRTYRVSGRRGTPRPGTFEVESKTHPGGTEEGLRLDHMVRFYKGAGLWVGFHAIPVGSRGPIQKQSQLGMPLSHGCVRQSPDDAKALWEFAPTGTKVVVLR